MDGPGSPQLSLDLRGTPCPVNYVRCRLAIEGLRPGQWLQVDLDGGEPETMVREGFRASGHEVRLGSGLETGVRLLIRSPGSEADGGAVCG